jgi:hypothetical protein
MKNINIADTPEAREVFEKYRAYIEAAAERYPVNVGRQGTVLYDQREFYPSAKP